MGLTLPSHTNALAPLHFRRGVTCWDSCSSALTQVSDSARALFWVAPLVMERSQRQPSNTMALLDRCAGRNLEMLKNGFCLAVGVFHKLPEVV